MSTPDGATIDFLNVCLFCSEMCLKFVKIFAHEHLLFTQAQLRVHIERGDVNISDQKGFTGHPQCEFCRSR